MEMLIAEDLLLLLLDDRTGAMANSTWLDTGIGGALLIELALAGSVDVVRGTGLWARAKVRPTGVAAPTDPLLGEALEEVSAKERTAQDLVSRLGRKRRETLLSRLEQKRVLRRSEDKVLGLFPRTRWPAVDSSHESEVRRVLADALLRGTQPDQRTAALVALLSAMELAHKVLDNEGLAARDVRRRATTLAEGDWAAKAVKDAVAAAQAAVTAGVLVATTSATSAG